VVSKKIETSYLSERGICDLPEDVEKTLLEIGGLNELERKFPDDLNLKKDAEFYQALSDPIRLLILHALDKLDLCPCLLKEITSVSDSKLSYHLGILEDSELIVQRRRRNWRIYSITVKGRRSIRIGK
jgi:ArsR family transcriptional regulator